MKALTLRQPWASFIAARDGDPAAKDIENRTWAVRFGWRPMTIAIHAGMRWDGLFRGDRAEWRYAGLIPAAFLAPWITRQEYPRGCIVAVATVVDCVRDHPSPWASGPWCWVLENVRRLDEPVSCRGAQGLWTLPVDVEAAVIESVSARRCDDA